MASGRRALLSVGTVAADPFKRLPIRPVIYWKTSSSLDEEPKEEKKEEEAQPGSSAAAPLEVDTSQAEPAEAKDAISPGFAALAGGAFTPREAGAENLDDSELGPPPGVGPSEGGAAAKPQLIDSKRAAAHDIELGIDLDDERPQVAKPAVAAVRPAGRVERAAAPPAGKRMSWSEYKKRAAGGQA